MANRKSNFPNAQQIDVEPGEMGAMVRLMEKLRGKDRPETDDELEVRVKWFFEWCIENDIRPGVELLALALGRTRQGLWVMQQRVDRRGQLIIMAKQIIAALLEQWGMAGKMNPATLCFLMKNNFGYHDDVQLQIEPRKMLEATQSPEEIEVILSRVEADIPIDADFEEI